MRKLKRELAISKKPAALHIKQRTNSLYISILAHNVDFGNTPSYILKDEYG